MVNPDCLKGMEFIEKFISDYEKFSQMGYNKVQILKMLGTLQYVQDFIHTPEWLESTTKLPNGYKWSDGTKYNQKSGKKNDTQTYIFLIIDDDLYIKNMLNRAYNFYQSDDEVNGVSESTCYVIQDKRICIIRRWKEKRSHHVVRNMDDMMTPFLEKCIHNFWHDNGGNICYIKRMEV